MPLREPPRWTTSRSKTSGKAKLHNLKTVTQANGNYVAVSRSGELAVLDEAGRERERVTRCHMVPCSPWATETPSKAVRSWRTGILIPTPSLLEVAGKVTFKDIIDGVTVQQQVDEVTGLSRMEVMDPKQRSAAAKDFCARWCNSMMLKGKSCTSRARRSLRSTC